MGGFLLTLLMTGIGSQLLMASAVPGPASPYALATLGIAAISAVTSTLIVGRLAGVRTLAQWVRALAAVSLPLLVTIVLLGLLPRGQ